MNISYFKCGQSIVCLINMFFLSAQGYYCERGGAKVEERAGAEAGRTLPVYSDHFGYKALSNKDTLNIKQYIIRTI